MESSEDEEERSPPKKISASGPAKPQRSTVATAKGKPKKRKEDDDFEMGSPAVSENDEKPVTRKLTAKPSAASTVKEKPPIATFSKGDKLVPPKKIE